jgi:hypothetical protein
MTSIAKQNHRLNARIRTRLEKIMCDRELLRILANLASISVATLTHRIIRRQILVRYIGRLDYTYADPEPHILFCGPHGSFSDDVSFGLLATDAALRKAGVELQTRHERERLSDAISTLKEIRQRQTLFKRLPASLRKLAEAELAKQTTPEAAK